ncbi:hypothetical protein FIV06_29190 (plasmid) [Labrenzia sp. THAF191b]|nr:hypothetical protein FIV06_29190 [Labrenzia sp. THAF191b]QFT08248.1 hypothetical protein FIV05_31155 [Labrenzia sp. THAF191a]QFT19388.1 hypothetical protein FIV03_29145 [Labrenzia sp. THAF187b]
MENCHRQIDSFVNGIRTMLIQRDLRQGSGLRMAGAAAAVFGVMTVVSGGTVLFGGDQLSRLAGNVVSFVLWFNFLAGFAYAMTGLGLWFARGWARWMAIAILIGTAIVLCAFLVYVSQGGPHETRTLVALIFRTGFWAIVTSTALRAVIR